MVERSTEGAAGLSLAMKKAATASRTTAALTYTTRRLVFARLMSGLEISMR
jgi:hypothetical protein